jgi:hypothetical protein
MRSLAVVAVLLVTACSSNSGVVQMGPGHYMVSRQAATGFSGSGTLKADAIREADSYCEQQGKTVQVLNSSESRPPYIFANFPKAEIEFTCVEPESSKD